MTLSLTMPNVDLGADTDLLAKLIEVWQARRRQNVLRSTYYDGERALKDFGISLPPQMAGIKAGLGWTAKGVHAVTDRSRLEGFVSASGGDDPFGLDEILWENRFLTEFPAASVSSAVHGCSFLTVTHGDVGAGEPDVLVLARAADESAALWDKRSRQLRAFLSISDTDEDGTVTEMIMWTPETVYTIVRERFRWAVSPQHHNLRRVPVAPLVHKFELRRPLGHSRITRASMYFADAGLRTIVRAEVSSEFYASPETYLFGPGVEQFVGSDRWAAIMGRIKALDVEDKDEAPQLHRFTGASPQPHTDQLRMWQALFADDQDLEVRFADSANPSSADAIFAAKESLITTTRDANMLWGHGAVQAMQMAVMLRDGTPIVSDELRSLRAQFTDPAIVSPTARADAYSKLAAADSEFATSRVGRQYAGLSLEQITQLEAEQRRAGASSRIAQLVEAARGLRDGNGGAGGGVPSGEPSIGGAGAA